ncbi:MAG: hypothetical protein EHM21_04245 [Chloroflexi bacterium]|nr:MAG: hypothetical protein EHM21_04245 [Chloroflexota bacterium]
MYRNLSTKLFRLSMAVVILAALALSLAKPVSAASPSISIYAVKANEIVTLHTQNFPVNVNFTVRMDVAGNQAIDGIVVGQTNSGIGGSFEVTYRIPAELRNVATIAIRMESYEGFYAYTWFVNRTSGSTGEPAPIPVTGGSDSVKPYLRILGVKSNETVTVEATSLPANTDFTVRVGPYYTFFQDYVITPSVRSDANGYVKWTIVLPSVVKDVSLVTIRIDGGGRYAFNAFKNVDSGSTIPVTSTGTCQVVSVTPGSSINKSSDFDAVWTIKNTSSKTWEASSVDYKYVSGSKIHTHNDRYDLTQTVKPGETVKVIVDMQAPSTTGFYTTNWALVESSTTLCNLSLNLRVK